MALTQSTVAVRVPHPLLSTQFREAAATVPNLEHNEKVVRLHLTWMLPLTSRFQVMFMGGPSFFTVHQNLATVHVPRDIREEAPFSTLTITNVTVTDVKDRPVGVNVGVDVSYEMARVRSTALLHDVRAAPGDGRPRRASGAVLYDVPDLDLYVSGTVNQITKRSLSHTCWPGW